MGSGLSQMRAPTFGGAPKKKTDTRSELAIPSSSGPSNQAVQERLTRPKENKPKEKVGGQPEGPGDKRSAKLDPTIQPNSESEHVKGATYEKVKGAAFIQGEGDAADVDINDVSQGKLGDCYLMAALAAIARSSPDTLRKMITSNKDGTYTVHFHEGGDVVVDDQFAKKDGEISFAGAGDGEAESEQGVELWVMLIEKAWAKQKGGYEAIRGRNIRMSSEDAMQAMTGKDTSELDPATDSEEFVLKALTEAQEKGWPATLGVRNITDVEETKACKKTGLVPNHAFAVMSVDAKAKTVEVYNPWGKEYKVPLLSLDTIKKYVSVIHINKD